MCVSACMGGWVFVRARMCACVYGYASVSVRVLSCVVLYTSICVRKRFVGELDGEVDDADSNDDDDDDDCEITSAQPPRKRA